MTLKPTPSLVRAQRPRWSASGALVLLAAIVLPTTAAAHDYPTLDRVRFVQDCMREHPGSAYEMTNKCACTLDRIAEKLSYDEFVNGSTALNANSIGGERGSYIRDAESLQNDIKRYRSLLSDSKKACFITSAPR